MTKKDAVEIVLAARHAAKSVGHEFAVDPDKLGSIGGFSNGEIKQIEAAVDRIENYIASELAALR